MTGPWSFDEARTACRDATTAQANAEKEVKNAFTEFAEAEERYRKALALEVLASHNDGVSWSTAPDLARGDEKVARLRKERDIAEGVKEAMLQAAWRRNADRKDAQRFADWSMRRELAEYHGEDPERDPDPSPLRSVA